MNKAIHKLPFLLWLTATFLTACSQDDAPVTQDNHPDTPQITVTRSTGQGSGGELSTIFQNGTEVGLSVQGSSVYTNMKYEYRDGALQAVGKNIAWDNGVTSLTVDAYYPYRSDGNYTNPIVLQDQSSEANYYQSDALHATGTVSKSSNSMSLDFKHRTAKVIFTFAEDVDEVSILNQALTQGGTINNTIKAYKETAQKWKACIIPTNGEIALNVKATESSKTAHFTLKPIKYEAGKQYFYAMNLINTDLSKGDVNLENFNGEITIIQSEGGKTTHNIYIKNCSPTVMLNGINTSGSISISADEGKNITPVIIPISVNNFDGNVGLRGATANVLIKGLEAEGWKKNGTIKVQINGHSAAIGSNFRSVCGNITIQDCTISVITSVYSGDNRAAGIGCGDDHADCGNITISNANISVQNGAQGGACIGGCTWSSCKDITITNSDIIAINDVFYEKGACIGSGSGGSANCGDITIQTTKSLNEFKKNLSNEQSSQRIGKGLDRGSVVGTITFNGVKYPNGID